MNPKRAAIALALGAALLLGSEARGQVPLGTAFTYQGRLTDAGSPAAGLYDFQFTLFDSLTGGSPVGPIVTRDDVTVTNGLFTVTLDFGAAFAGSKRWLEIGVRPGASTGAYTTLSPRQELTPNPNAVFSATVPWTGISGKPAGFADDVDNDTLAALSCTSGQLAKWNGTAWACAADIDTNSGGTVTSVATGAGLTGGPVTTSGTVSVATGGITSSMIADRAVSSAKITAGAVGLAQIDQSQVQARVGGTCPVGHYLRGINPNGTVVCEPIYAPSNISTVDATAVGTFPSIAIGTDGLPVVSYYDSTAGALKVAHCGNPACSAGSTLTYIENLANNVGQYTSIAVGTDGLPVVSYHDSTAGTLKVAHCGNTACSAGNTITTVDDPANFVGDYTSIAIGADGLPVVSYRDATAGTLKVAHCGNTACTAGNTVTTVDDPANPVGLFTSIAIGADGLPVISYEGITIFALKVAHCGNTACTAGNVITTVDSPGTQVGLYTSIAVGSDGLPVISYQDFNAGTLKVAHCGNADCTAGNVITTVDRPGHQVGFATSIAIGSDNLPVISYQDFSAGTLKVAHCGNAACNAGNTITSVDAPGVGTYTAIAIGTDGLPVISYHGTAADTLKVAKCSTRTCQ